MVLVRDEKHIGPACAARLFKTKAFDLRSLLIGNAQKIRKRQLTEREK